MDFKSVVFAGGGTRCLWQVGFWDIVASEMNIKPEVVAGVSSGAYMATVVMSGRSAYGFNLMKSFSEANRKNFYIKNLLKRKPLFPHYSMYRKALVTLLEEETLATIKNGPEIRVAIAHPPVLLGPKSGIIGGVLAHKIETRIKLPVHLVSGRKLGYTASVARLNDCETAEEAADLIMCSSCTPPFLPVHRYNGKIALDGGVYDNVPVFAIGEDEKRGDMMILLTRQFDLKRIPKIPGRVYVQPSETPPAAMWEATNPDSLQKAYDIGRKDGDKFIKQYLK